MPAPGRLATASALGLALAAGPGRGRADDEDVARRLFLRGKDLVRKGDLPKAAEMFERAIAKDLTEVAAMRQLGRVRERMHRFDLAVEAYRQYLEMVPAAPDAYAIREAVRRCAEGRRKELADQDRGRGRRPGDLRLPSGLRAGGKAAKAEARRRYDEARTRNDNSSDEERLYREAVELDPGFAEAWYNLGILYLMRDDPERAIWAHRRFAALTPDSHEGHFLLGVDHQARGDLSAAAEAYRRALARNPRHFDSLNNLAVVLERRGDADGTLLTYRQALSAALPGRGVQARYSLGDLYLRKGMLDAAVRERQTILGAEQAAQGAAPGARPPAVPARLRAQTHNALGEADEGQGRLADALGAYTAALALDPEFQQARENLLRARARVP